MLNTDSHSHSFYMETIFAGTKIILVLSDLLKNVRKETKLQGAVVISAVTWQQAQACILSSVCTCAVLWARCWHSAHVRSLQSRPCCIRVRPASQINVGGVERAAQRRRKWGAEGGRWLGWRGYGGEMVKIEMDGTDTMSNGRSSWENKNTQGTLKPEGWKICGSGGRSDSPPYLIQFYKL